MSTSDWNAERYHRISEPQWRWGLEVLSELELAGKETVIDAGCGTGRLSTVLLGRLPQGRVIAVDSSKAMMERARKELARFDERVAFVEADLANLTLGPVADVVFSTATFHWVLDHQALVKSLFQVLKPGGRLHAQCGGVGNLQRFLAGATEVATRAPFAASLTGFESPLHFSSPEAFTEVLQRAGFVDVKCWLKPAPTSFESKTDFVEFIGTVVLRHHVARLPEAERAPYLEAVASSFEDRTLDYVRLEIRARKP
jgi:trans-aconitate 2-methyltransferase